MSEWTTVEDTKPTDPISRDVIVKLFSSLNSCSRLASPDSPPVQNSGRVAVLIGVENAYINGRHHPCLGSYKDVVYMCDMLIARFGYTPEDITVMMDIGEYRDSEYFPTCENVDKVLRCMAERLQRAAPTGHGDIQRAVFYFSGHGSQKVCTTGEEVDGMDEMIALNDGFYSDNRLKERLVDTLPLTGCQLTAVFDACCSGTMLDLDMSRCYNVRRPAKLLLRTHVRLALLAARAFAQRRYRADSVGDCKQAVKDFIDASRLAAAYAARSQIIYISAAADDEKAACTQYYGDLTGAITDLTQNAENCRSMKTFWDSLQAHLIVEGSEVADTAQLYCFGRPDSTTKMLF